MSGRRIWTQFKLFLKERFDQQLHLYYSARISCHITRYTPDRWQSRTDERVDERGSFYWNDWSAFVDSHNDCRQTWINRFWLPNNRFRQSKTLFIISNASCSSIYFSFRIVASPVRGSQRGNNVRKRTFGNELPAKIQISLRVRAVWLEFSLGAFLIAKRVQCVIENIFCQKIDELLFYMSNVRQSVHFCRAPAFYIEWPGIGVW